MLEEITGLPLFSMEDFLSKKGIRAFSIVELRINNKREYDNIKIEEYKRSGYVFGRFLDFYLVFSDETINKPIDSIPILLPGSMISIIRYDNIREYKTINKF